MMVGMRPWTKYTAAMAELRRTSAPLASTARSLLLIWFLVTARYFSASLGRSISLTAIHQLRGDNLVENRHIRGDSEHLLAQFELFYGLSGHVIHCCRGHFGYLIPCFLIVSRPPLAPGTEPFISSRLRSGSACTTCNFLAVTRSLPIRPAMRVPFKTRPGVVPEPIEPGARVRSD